MASEILARKSWIYLSPHFDDVALSCGGLVWEQAQAGVQGTVWTICAGEIPPGSLSPFAEALHHRWGTGREAVGQRRAEDIVSCKAMQAGYYHFPLPDCIYRQAGVDYWAGAAPKPGEYLYTSEDAIFKPIAPAEEALVKQLCTQLIKALPAEAEIVCPMALGGHVDHRLTRAAAQRLERHLWYYADYPYVLRASGELQALEKASWQRISLPISTAGLKAWQQAVAAHRSQISTFWPDQKNMEQAIASYMETMGGGVLWRDHRAYH